MKRIIIGLFLVLLAGAIFFSRERILFCDAAFILFRILNFNNLQIQEHRYGSFITQLVPLMGGRLHLPLGMITVLYTASFNLFYLVVAWLVAFRFRQTGLATLMGLYFVLFASDTYFWTNNEVHQGIAWMFLWLAVTKFMKEKKSSPLLLIPAFTLLAFLAIFTHPLVMFPAVFLWLFFLLEEKSKPPHWISFVMFMVLAVICFARLKFSTGASSYHDAEKLSAWDTVHLSGLLHTFTSPMARELVQRSITNYWLVPLLFLTGMYSAIRQRKFRATGLVVLFCLVYFMAVCITFSDFIPFYTESEWMPFSILAATPFVFYTLPRLQPRTAAWIMALIFVVRLVYIVQASEKFTRRKEAIETVLKQMDRQQLNKAIVPEDETIQKTFIMNWGVPAESLLASALRKDHPLKNFVILRTGDSTSIPANPRRLLIPFSTIHYTRLNPVYFSCDTVSVYRQLQ